MMVRFKIPVTFIILFLSIVLSVLAQANQRDSHEVEAGETLFSISQQYNISVEELQQWNDLEGTSIEVGQQLYVESEPDIETHEVTHIVESGETLFSISRIYGVEVNQIQQWNNIDGTQLSVGQPLTIETNREADLPKSDPEAPDHIAESEEETEPQTTLPEDEDAEAPSTERFHTVQRNETLYQISNQYNMEVDHLIELNEDIDDPTDLNVGQSLRVRSFISLPSLAAEGAESAPYGQYYSYSISESEALSDILGHNRMDQSEFLALNPDKNAESVRDGDAVTLLSPVNVRSTNPYRISSPESGRRMPVTVYEDNQLTSTTTSGDLYNPEHLTAAHPNISLGSVVYLENPDNQRGVYVLINDRTTGRSIKISRATQQALQISNGQEVLIQEN